MDGTIYCTYSYSESGKAPATTASALLTASHGTGRCHSHERKYALLARVRKYLELEGREAQGSRRKSRRLEAVARGKWWGAVGANPWPTSLITFPHYRGAQKYAE